jgi:hypothetical protein
MKQKKYEKATPIIEKTESKMKRKRCEKGTHKNKKTGLCERI